MQQTNWYALICEGPSESRLMERLMEIKALCFEKRQVIGQRPYIRKDIWLALPQIHSLPPAETITLLRVGDTLNDALTPKSLGLNVRHQQGTLKIAKACTKPEIEMLVIVALKKMPQYKKSGLKPKGFVRGCIKNPKDFYAFLNGVSDRQLIQCILDYRSIKGRAQPEPCVADYLSKKIPCA